MDSTWKVLIADDEPIIREGIRESVDWEALRMTVVAEAEDGEEALELALKHAVDVLLVDLNMPIMNGITLMKHIREQLPDCRIVIVSGHDEFTYAQEAIRLNVDDYILKPVNPVQLRNLLGKICTELEGEAKQSEHLKLASEQIQKNLPLLRERFCLQWMEGNLKEEEIVNQLQFLNLPSSCPNQFAVIRWPEFNSNQPLMKESDRQLLLFAIENIAGELLEPFPKVIFRDDSELIIVCLWGEAPENTFMEIEKAAQSYLKITVNVHFVPFQGALTDMAAVYRQCKIDVSHETMISPVVRRARQYIREHYSDPEVSLEAYANSMQISPVYLSRIFKHELGISFISFLTQTRIHKAIQLLNSTDLSINEIAVRVGYETQHYFSTAFKKSIGVSPNQYRKGAAFTEQ